VTYSLLPGIPLKLKRLSVVLYFLILAEIIQILKQSLLFEIQFIDSFLISSFQLKNVERTEFKMFLMRLNIFFHRVN
jgi:hypothetical protein